MALRSSQSAGSTAKMHLYPGVSFASLYLCVSKRKSVHGRQGQLLRMHYDRTWRESY